MWELIRYSKQHSNNQNAAGGDNNKLEMYILYQEWYLWGPLVEIVALPLH